MDAILISWNPARNEVRDVKKHLADGHKYYWRLKFTFGPKSEFTFPIFGYVHMKGGKVEYRLTVEGILPFSASDYQLPEPVIPESWIQDWNKFPDQREAWKSQLVVTKIEEFSGDTLSLQRLGGAPVRIPPRKYVRIVSPENQNQGKDAATRS